MENPIKKYWLFKTCLLKYCDNGLVKVYHNLKERSNTEQNLRENIQLSVLPIIFFISPQSK